jgi:hypothetical protein
MTTKYGKKWKPLTKEQKDSLDFLILDKFDITYHPKTSNVFEHHKLKGKHIVIWIRLNGKIIVGKNHQ